MANSSNNNNPPPGGGSWATPHDWATHRATITALYEGQNMTLKKIMHIMESDHKFLATERMYKSRLKQWGLRKNYRYEEVNEMIRQQTTRTPLANLRVRKEGRKRLRRQPNAIKSGYLPASSQHVIVRTAMQQLTPPPVGPSCRIRTPPGQPEISFLFPLTPPADLLYPEECSHHIQRYCAGAFENRLWTLDSPEWMNTSRGVVDWFNRMALARGALASGHTQQGFKLLQICFDEYKDMIAAQDPRLMLYTTVALLLLVGYPDIVAMLLRYISNLTKILQGPYHPLHQIMESLSQMGIVKMQENARALFEAQISEFERYLPSNNTVLQSMAIFAIRNLAVSGLIDTDVAEARLLTFSTVGDNGRISMALAQVLMMGKRYAEARRICNELLSSGIDRTRTVAGAFDTLFLICRMEGRDELIRDASIRRIAYCLKTFGAENDWTVDACSDYEKYLRDVGKDDEADKVFTSFGVQMDKLTEGVEELEIK